MAVDVPTDLITGVEISRGSWPHHVPRELACQWCTRYPGDDVADSESELGIEAQGAGMVGRKHEPHPQIMPGSDALEHGLHKVLANRAILHSGSNRNRAEASDRRAFIEEVTANDASIQLRHDRI